MVKVKLCSDRNFKVGKIDRRVFGSFIEHMGRCVYTGIYEKTHATADENGFRGDVIEAIRDMGVSIVRYPGGNFVSGYNWKDAIGKERVPKIDLAWKQIEPNEVGVDEYMKFAEKCGMDTIMCVNLGTGTGKEAVELLEYCNMDTPTYWANLRRTNGRQAPYGIRTWCLGNEMDGPWQICVQTAHEYGRKALETAKMLKWADPSIELVACGSSFPGIATYPEWDKTVMEYLYDHCDYISMHRYYEYPIANKDVTDLLGCYVDLQKIIDTITATCDYVKGVKRSDKTMMIALDEWNVSPRHPGFDDRQEWVVGPVRAETTFDVADVLAFSNLLCTILNNCDRVKIAALAQLVNVLGPIMTVKGGRAWRQTIYYPFALFAKYAKGEAFRLHLESPTARSATFGEYRMLCGAVTFDEETGTGAIFAVNNSLTEDMQLKLEGSGLEGITVTEHVVFSHENVFAHNSAENPDCVTPKTAKKDDFTLGKHSLHIYSYRKNK